MAQTAAKRQRKARTTKAQAKLDVVADNSTVDNVDTDEDDAIAKAAQEEADAKLNEARHDMGSKLGDMLEDLANADKESALEARKRWCDIGRTLKDAEALFISEDSNQVNDKAYGQWIKAEGLTAIGSRPTRAAAKWLSDVHDTNPDLWALFPTESQNGQPLRRSPQTLYSWVRERVYVSFQNAFDNTGDDDGSLIQPATGLKGEDREKAAKTSMPNVIDVARATAEALEDAANKAHENMQAVTDPKAKQKAKVINEAMAESITTRAAADQAQLDLDLLMNLTDEERTKFFMGWKPKVAAIKFNDRSLDDAAAYLLEKFVAGFVNPGPVELVDRLKAMLEDHMATVDADDGNVDDDADDVDMDDDVDMLDDDFDDDDFDDDFDDFDDED